MNRNYNDSKPFELKCSCSALEIRVCVCVSQPSKSFGVLTNRQIHLQILKSKVYLKLSALHQDRQKIVNGDSYNDDPEDQE